MDSLPVDSILDFGSNGVLLEQFMRAQYMPAGMLPRVRDRHELPAPLQRIIDDAAGIMEWRAYQDGTRLWFATTPIVRATHASGRPILDVYLFDENGTPSTAGRWLLSATDEWQLVERLALRGPPRG